MRRRIRDLFASDPPFIRQLLELDGKLTAKGFPPLSPFWKRELRRLYSSSVRRLVARVGRRGGKSTTWAKLAVAVALFGEWTIPPGERAMVAFLSVDRPEAGARLRSIRAMLDALGVAYTPRGEELELADRPATFRVFTASIAGVVGFSCILAICDEVAKWKDAATGANPAAEVIASLMPTMATQPGARLILSSSPWSTTDYHATAFDTGNNEHQLTCKAPSWIANDSLSEAETHALEPDVRIWAREYLAEPSDAVSSICTASEYDACVSPGVDEREPIPNAVFATLVDPAFRRDNFAVLSVHRELRARGGDGVDDVLVVDRLTLLEPTLLRKITVIDGVRAIAQHARAFPGRVFTDQFFFDALSPACAERGVKLVELPSTPTAISQRIANLQVRFSSGTLALLDDKRIRKEVLGAQLQLHQGGRMTLKVPERSGHDDIVSCLLLASDHEVIGRLPPTEGDVEVETSPVLWDGYELSGGQARYYRRMPGGGRVMCEPPVGSPMFDEYAEGMIASGHSSPAVARWLEERQEGAALRRSAFNVEMVDGAFSTSRDPGASSSGGWLFGKK
jgi:hypothetical protein